MATSIEYNYRQTVTADILNNVDNVNDITMPGTLTALNVTASHLFILENASIISALSSDSLTVAGNISGGSASFSDLLTTNSLNVIGVAVFSSPAVMSGAGIARSTILASSIAPVATRSLAITEGAVVSIDTLTDPVTEFALALTGDVHALQFFNMVLYSHFDIFMTNPLNIPCTVNKQLSYGTVTCYNTLAGNVNVAPGSVWCIKGKCVAPNVVILDFINYT